MLWLEPYYYDYLNIDSATINSFIYGSPSHSKTAAGMKNTACLGGNEGRGVIH